jgi:WD40 repeat protein
LIHEGQVVEAAFSQNGKWLATACDNWTARVFDIVTSRPITPPIKHTDPIQHVQFVEGDQSILTASSDGKAWLWRLPFAKGEPARLAELAAFLAARSTEYSSEGSGDLIKKSWDQLQRHFPQNFKVTDEERIAWFGHHFRACEANGQWSAAIFHLDHLDALLPNDRELEEYRTRLMQKSSLEAAAMPARMGE